MKHVQTSESIRLGVILALSGGFMDAYSYIGRGGVFANAETGNVVLMAIRLGEGDVVRALSYLVPIGAFALGVMISEAVRHRCDDAGAKLHWRQFSVTVEILAMLVVAALPQQMNGMANSLISLTCGIQVSAFAKIYGHVMATTMCTGNLRSGTQLFGIFLTTGDRAALKRGLFYYGCIVIFFLGAMVGGYMTTLIRERASLVVAGALMLAFMMMFRSGEVPRR